MSANRLGGALAHPDAFTGGTNIHVPNSFNTNKTCLFDVKHLFRELTGVMASNELIHLNIDKEFCFQHGKRE